MTICCVIGCKNVGTHSFPKDPTIRRKWIAAIRIKKFVPTKYTRLCREHFNENDYESSSTITGLPLAHKFLKKNAVPSIFWWKQKPVRDCDIARAERYARRSRRNILEQPFPSQEGNVTCISVLQDPVINDQTQPSTTNQHIPEPPESEIQTGNDENREITTNIEKNLVTASTQTPTVLSLFSTDYLIMDEESVNFYTGLENAEKFRLILSTLMPMAENLEYRWSNVQNMAIDDQFLIVLIKLRRAKPDFELAKMFGVSKTQISNIFITWINFMYDVWSMIDIWPSRDLINYYMPENFKKNNAHTRVIIDCTEIPIEKPSNPRSQQITFSSYKNTNTLKFLVGSTPGGLLSYCSEGYGGSTSDRQMIERSSVMNLCEEGDSIMADRGFNVQDLFAPKNVAINIPTFLKGRSQLPGVALLNDRKIASQRVHIERLIGLTKTYKILKTQLKSYYVPLASKIFFVCVMLCNFKECIVNKTSEQCLTSFYYVMITFI